MECRRAQRGSGPETETRVVPWASHGIAHHDPLRERATIVAARCTNREDLLAAPDEQHRLAIRMAQKKLSFTQSSERNAPGQVRATKGRSLITHDATSIVLVGLPEPGTDRCDAARADVRSLGLHTEIVKINMDNLD
jgi:hypothetical protein